MGTPLGFKTFNTGDVLTATDTNGYLMQGVWTFASAAARDAAVTSPQEGNMCYLKDTDAVQSYSGSAWVAVGSSGGMTLLSTTTLSASTTTVSSISGAYNKLFVEIVDMNPGTNGNVFLRFNSDATSAAYQGIYSYFPASTANGTKSVDIIKDTSYYLATNTVIAGDNNNYMSFELPNYASSVRKVVSSLSNYVNSGSSNVTESGTGTWFNAAAVTSISIIGFGTFTGGSIKIWGIK